MKGCKESQISLGRKETTQPKRGLLFSRPQGKKPLESNEKDTTDMESLQRMIKKLSNEIMDMKRNVGEGSSYSNTLQTFL
jgi:hypothetical protein